MFVDNLGDRDGYKFVKLDNTICGNLYQQISDSKVQGANMGHTWVLPAPDGPHVGPMNLAIRGD